MASVEIHAVLEDIRSALALSTQGTAKQRDRLRDYEAFLRSRSHVLARDPGQLWSLAADEPLNSAVHHDAVAGAAPQDRVWFRRLNPLVHRVSANWGWSTAGAITTLAATGAGSQRSLWAATSGGSIFRLDPETGAELGAPLRGNAAVRSMVVIPGESPLLVYGCLDGQTVALQLESRDTVSHPGDGAAIESLAASDGDQLVYLGDERGNIFAWDISHPGERRLVASLGAAVTALACIGQGEWLAAGFDDGEILLLRPSSGERRVLLEVAGFPTAVAWSEDARALWITSFNGEIWRHHPNDASTVQVASVSRPILSLALLSPDGTALIGCEDGSVFAVVEDVRELPREDGAILALASLDATGGVAVGTSSGHVRARFAGGSREPQANSDDGRITHLAAVPTGSLLLAGTDSGEVLCFDAAGVRQAKKSLHHGAVSALAAGADEGTTFSASADFSLVCWRRSEPELHAIMMPTRIECLVSPAAASELTVYAAGHDGHVYLCDFQAGTFHPISSERHRFPVRCLAARGDWLAAGSDDRTISLHSLSAPGPRLVLERHQSAVMALCLLPCGDKLLSADAQGKIILWDIERQSPVMTFQAMAGPVQSLSAIPGRNAVALAAGAHLEVWLLDEPRRVAAMECDVRIAALEVLPNRQIAIADDRGNLALYVPENL